MSDSKIAVIGIACRYPDAESPDELWRNVLAGRRAFRRLPDERMRLDDYYDPDPAAPDRFYADQAAVIEGFEFDRVKYRVAGSTFRSTDMTHWLALDTAARALESAGFPMAEGLAGLNTGVVIGNSLTGEFSRANLMRLRWPYVRRTAAAALRERGWQDDDLADFLDDLEERYKQPFPAIDEDTLAGGLANTIAGRICNHFDLKGGGFTVDGACSSSLLAVATACNALVSGQLDVAIAGGVDLSIDPFEVIGFAKTGALSTSEMKVYDRRSNGFWPGEGCGIIVLTRDDIARDLGKVRYATVAGWGYASDGKGGITRPEASGHRMAIERAYAMAGFGMDTVGYLEGHGTGTAVGDATELQALSQARRAADPSAPPVALGTVKGNIGHTKAAAGVAGLIKAVQVIRHQVIPPATGHFDPHPELTGERPALRVPGDAEPWPQDVPVRAGVSSMGFGGINAHIVLERADDEQQAGAGESTAALVRSRQDAEVLLLDAANHADLAARLGPLAELSGRISYAELADLATTLHRDLAGRPIRAAIVAASPAEAKRRLEQLRALIGSGATSAQNTADGIYLGRAGRAPRIGFLFPGQGAGRRADGGALRRRFAVVDDLYRHAGLPTGGDQIDTAVAQPRIVTSSVAALRVLAELGIDAIGAAGHSLGELTALHWAGALTQDAVLGLAATRGRVMGELSSGGGTMAGIAAAPDAVEPLIAGTTAVIAGHNGPQQTVVSGDRDAVAEVTARATAQGLEVSPIAVSHAFHSPAIAPASGAFAEYLARQRFAPVGKAVYSTVTGARLAGDADISELLTRQLVQPVRYAEAVEALAAEADLLIEAGPGGILSGLAAHIAPAVPSMTVGADSPSLSGLLRVVAAAFALGAPVNTNVLFDDRFHRPLELTKEFRFFASPCESAADEPTAKRATAVQEPVAAAAVVPTQESALAVLIRLAAERAELPVAAVHPDSNPLDELHLSSITVGQIVNQAAKELDILAPLNTASFATSTLGQLAEILDGLAGEGVREEGISAVHGVAPWTRAFSVDSTPSPLPAGGARARVAGRWQLFAPQDHPLAERLAEALRQADLGDGVLLCLPRDCGEQHVALMLEAARTALAAAGPVRFVVAGDRRSAAGLAKTLHLESPQVTTTVVALPLADRMPDDRVAAAVAAIAGDVAATSGFAEVSYDDAGVRHVPVLRPLPLEPAHDPAAALGPDDVVLVTGGGKGITFESAFAVGKQSGAALGLLGRSDPAADPELAANLARLTTAGIRFRYVAADVTAAPDVKAAVDTVRQAFGDVTAVIHGAGRNEPGGLATLAADKVLRTLAPKIGGLEAVLAATDPARLRLLVSFGSIIGRAGLKGEADYALANDWLTELTRRTGETNPACRTLAIEWTVWSGSGMGERLGVIESLARDGVEPIPTEDGVAMLGRLIADPRTPPVVVVMGRADGLPTVTLDKPELPLARFVDRSLVYYPGVELITETTLSAESDPYLADHLLDGQMLLPAVLGFEAMAQVATALIGSHKHLVIQDADLLRPIVVPVDGTTTVRVAALATAPDTVQVAIRSSETGYQADHFRATVHFREQAVDTGASICAPPVGRRLAVRPDVDLYGSVLFQGDRFQRLLAYRQLAATSCVAEISTESSLPWFAGYLPDTMLTGDPGARDAYMHALQCCVPDATLLPQAVERLYLAAPDPVRQHVVLKAEERLREGDSYVYDIDVFDDAGTLVERWEGLRLRAVRKQDGSGPWVPELLGPYLERRTGEMVGRDLRCVVWPDGAESSVDLKSQSPFAYARNAGLTLAVLGDLPVSCAVSTVHERSGDEWAGLLGAPGLELARKLAAATGTPLSAAATHVLGATESLQDATGLALAADPGHGARWVQWRTPSARLATFATTLRGQDDPVVLTIGTEAGA